MDPGLIAPGVQERLTRLLDRRAEVESWLRDYRPPFRDRRFWAVQVLVVMVAVLHDTIESLRLLGHLGAHTHSLSFVPISLFFVPIVYAALNFGFVGSVATALWCTVLTIPNFILFHHGLERLGELFQLAIINAIAVFVGQRVDRETRARACLEATGAALQASEMEYRGLFEKYLGLFESSPAAILLLHPGGLVLEANPAAAGLFARHSESMKGLALRQLLGSRNAVKLAGLWGKEPSTPTTFQLQTKGGGEVYLHPTVTRFRSSSGGALIQLLLHDVTGEQRRQAGLQAYAAHIIRAQEDERKRLAQEVHDESIQELILLCRELDSLEGSCQGWSPAAVADLRQARSRAERLVAGLRDLIKSIRPGVLEDLGLVASIDKLLGDLEERNGLATRLTVEGEERRLPADAELNLFRIVQEALRNVERHAQAGEVSVGLTFGRRAVSLEVRDDGKGFTALDPPEASDAGNHLGLLGMQERAQMLGGTVEVVSAAGSGTQVSVSVPIAASASGWVPRPGRPRPPA